jgi:hypothetical protein
VQFFLFTFVFVTFCICILHVSSVSRFPGHYSTRENKKRVKREKKNEEPAEERSYQVHHFMLLYVVLNHSLLALPLAWSLA